LLSQIISLCADNSTPVYADPKNDHFFDFKKVTLLKPNLNEMNRAMGNANITDSQMNDQGQKSRKKLQCDLLLLTLGEKGMTLFDESGAHSIPTRARNVHDVSGAGDTVIAAFALAHICGSSSTEAAAIANYAAGSVVEQAGVVIVTKEDLHNIISHHNPD
jgi:rfaE bifunctional protein kinase chain/domain